MSQEDYSEAENKAHILLKAHDVTGAISVLDAARNRARAQEDWQTAGDFSSWIASLFLSVGQTHNALVEFAAAERDEPANPFAKLIYAEQMLALQDNAEAALSKLEEVAPNLPSNASVLHGYYDLLGRALLRLSRVEEAIEAFRKMADENLTRGVMAQSLCLILCGQLINATLALTECDRYLDLVDAKADRCNAVDVQAKVRHLRELLSEERARHA